MPVHLKFTGQVKNAQKIDWRKYNETKTNFKKKQINIAWDYASKMKKKEHFLKEGLES